jgi:subtilisin family serine protease
MLKRLGISLLALTILLLICIPTMSAIPKKTVGVNVVLNTSITREILADLGRYGTVRDIVSEIRSLTMVARPDKLDAIRALPYVSAANPDADRSGAPVDTVGVDNFADGLSTWNLDAVNVTTGPGYNDRQVDYDGTGVFVAVLDTGLLDSWRQYFPQERIAVEYARCFGGGGADVGRVAEQPMKWEHDQNSHGTHVTSTIIGYQFGISIDGVAPLAKIIPVKVLNQNGHGWSSVIARGIVYVADLKAGPLAGYPVIINMSLGGPALDAMEKAAIDYAISQGVIIVASAGNQGTAGMDYPGAYSPVISVAASGWVDSWPPDNTGWYYNTDVPDPTNPQDFYIPDFSARQLAGQDLDVAAPGAWIVGPYQFNSGKISYYYLNGTSMASPHVAGIVALMAQKNPALTAAQAETILESSAVPLPPGCRTVHDGNGTEFEFCWGADATGAGLTTADAALVATP